MPRLMPSARSSGTHYRHFAFGVLAVAAIIAVASDGSSGEALVPQAAEAPARMAATAPSTAIIPQPVAPAWHTEADDAGPAPDMGEAGEPDTIASEDEEATPAMPAPGRKGPADGPTPAQLEKLLADSRLRSGAPPDGD